jgi:DNA end-binding protein Ku
MQTIWKGAISFGLVSIPVKVFSATEEHGVSLRQVHAADGGRIRYRRMCELDGAEVPYSDIAKGYDLGGGELVVLDDADLESLPLASTKAVEVLQFVAAEELDPVAVARSYYLQADLHGAKPYVLLRDALAKAGRVAIVKVALRSRESLATIRPHGDVLLLQMLLWPEEIRDPAALAPDADVTVRQQEVDMAQAYIETMTSSFDPAEYTDEYAAALRALVDAKVAGRQIVSPQEAAQPAAEVVDLMEALRQSVARARARRAGTAENAAPDAASEPSAQPAKATKRPAKTPAAKTKPEPMAQPAPAKKASATKAAAKSAPAKKAQADKAPAKKSAAKRTA